MGIETDHLRVIAYYSLTVDWRPDHSAVDVNYREKGQSMHIRAKHDGSTDSKIAALKTGVVQAALRVKKDRESMRSTQS